MNYMESVAGVVTQFERLQQLAFDATGNGVTAPQILDPFFNRIDDNVTLKAICQIKELNDNCVFIFFEFVKYLKRKHSVELNYGGPGSYLTSAIENIEAKLKDMQYKETPSVTDYCSWTFIWKNANILTPIRTDSAKVCFPRPNNKIEQGYNLSNPSLLLYKQDGVIHWTMTFNSKITQRGQAASYNDGAEQSYHAFFQYLTERKFRNAMIPDTDKMITILGNWISMEELSKSKEKYQNVSFDDRRAEVFVIGWPEMCKDTIELPITRVGKLGRADANTINPMDYNIFCDKLYLSGILDWYVSKPEQYVNGDCYCKKCKNIYTAMGMDVRYVRSYGPLCGPCRDHYQGDLDVNIDALLVG